MPDEPRPIEIAKAITAKLDRSLALFLVKLGVMCHYVCLTSPTMLRLPALVWPEDSVSHVSPNRAYRTVKLLVIRFTRMNLE
jgi:hypothetical protein